MSGKPYSVFPFLHLDSNQILYGILNKFGTDLLLTDDDALIGFPSEAKAQDYINRQGFLDSSTQQETA